MTLSEEIKIHTKKINHIFNDNISLFFTLIALSFIFLAPSQTPKFINNQIGLWYVVLSKVIFFYAWACMLTTWTSHIRNGCTEHRITNPFIPRIKIIILGLAMFAAWMALKSSAMMFRGAISMNNIYLAVYTNQILCTTAYTMCVFLLFRSSYKILSFSQGIKMSFISSFKATSGHEAKIILSATYVAIPYIILFALYPYIISIIGELAPILTSGLAGKITWIIMMAPMQFILGPIIITIFLISLIIAYTETLEQTNDFKEKEEAPFAKKDSSPAQETEEKTVEPKIEKGFFDL